MNKIVAKVLVIWFIVMFHKSVPDQPILTEFYKVICVLCILYLLVYILDNYKWAQWMQRQWQYWALGASLFLYYIGAMVYDWYRWGQIDFVAVDIAFMVTDIHIASNYFKWFMNPADYNIGKVFSIFFAWVKKALI